jgi:hypothetical protein
MAAKWRRQPVLSILSLKVGLMKKAPAGARTPERRGRRTTPSEEQWHA